MLKKELNNKSFQKIYNNFLETYEIEEGKGLCPINDLYYGYKEENIEQVDIFFNYLLKDKDFSLKTFKSKYLFIQSLRHERWDIIKKYDNIKSKKYNSMLFKSWLSIRDPSDCLNIIEYINYDLLSNSDKNLSKNRFKKGLLFDKCEKHLILERKSTLINLEKIKKQKKDKYFYYDESYYLSEIILYGLYEYLNDAIKYFLRKERYFYLWDWDLKKLITTYKDTPLIDNYIKTFEILNLYRNNPKLDKIFNEIRFSIEGDKQYTEKEKYIFDLIAGTSKQSLKKVFYGEKLTKQALDETFEYDFQDKMDWKVFLFKTNFIKEYPEKDFSSKYRKFMPLKTFYRDYVITKSKIHKSEFFINKAIVLQEYDNINSMAAIKSHQFIFNLLKGVKEYNLLTNKSSNLRFYIFNSLKSFLTNLIFKTKDQSFKAQLVYLLSLIKIPDFYSKIDLKNYVSYLNDQGKIKLLKKYEYDNEDIDIMILDKNFLTPYVIQYIENEINDNNPYYKDWLHILNKISISFNRFNINNTTYPYDYYKHNKLRFLVYLHQELKKDKLVIKTTVTKILYYILSSGKKDKYDIKCIDLIINNYNKFNNIKYARKVLSQFNSLKMNLNIFKEFNYNISLFANVDMIFKNKNITKKILLYYSHNQLEFTNVDLNNLKFVLDHLTSEEINVFLEYNINKNTKMFYEFFKNKKHQIGLKYIKKYNKNILYNSFRFKEGITISHLVDIYESDKILREKQAENLIHYRYPVKEKTIESQHTIIIKKLAKIINKKDVSLYNENSPILKLNDICLLENKVCLKVIKTNTELLMYSKIMRNCIDGYTHSVLKGNSNIIIIYKDDNPYICLDVIGSINDLKMKEIKFKGNDHVPDSLSQRIMLNINKFIKQNLLSEKDL